MKKLFNLVVCFLSVLLLSSCLSGGSTSSDSNSSLPQVSLVPLNNTVLPVLSRPGIAYFNGYWLIFGGRTTGFHAFHHRDANPNIYVYNPSTNQLYSESIENTDLAEPVREQLLSIAQQRLLDNDTMYLAGGYYNYPQSESYTTLQIISSFNVPGMVDAIINHSESLNQFVHYNTTSPIFKSTGGGLGKIGNDFYLAFGQECEGYYCNDSQIYMNTIYQFNTTKNLESINLINFVYSPESSNSGFRRRDYSLVPFKVGHTDTLLALAGPFTGGDTPYVWNNVINFDGNINYNNSFINQQANQYDNAFLPIHSSNSDSSYLITFGGLSNLYWSTSGLSFDNTSPYGNILDLISYNDNTKTTHEYANIQPLCSGFSLESCVYNGTDSVYIRAISNIYDNRGILKLDSISGPTLVGYVYGGITSNSQNVFVTPSNSEASNQVFAVYVTPNRVSNNWVNITNLESATPYTPYSVGM